MFRPFEGRLRARSALLSNGSSRIISAILVAVRILFLGAFFLLIAGGFVVLPLRSAPARQSPPQETQQQAAPAQPAQLSASSVVVIDPAHGGIDTGARGEGGKVEKDIALEIARSVRVELERQGYRVLMTRTDDSNPSYDDRAALANAHRNSIFVCLHVASTGTAGTVRAYFEQFGSPFPLVSAAPNANPKTPSFPTSSLPMWDDAQRPFVTMSHTLADLVQIQLSQSFSGSPVSSTGVALRGLRSVGAPAVAIEISSVSVSDLNSLTSTAAPLAAALARGLQAFRGSMGAN
jgi:N-acetylmuramoyl-L-alanine amidase